MFESIGKYKTLALLSKEAGIQPSVESNLSSIMNWLICSISLLVSNLSCFVLCSFFLSILPTKRNLLTYLDTVLVVAMTSLVNALVSANMKYKITTEERKKVQNTNF